MDKVNEEGLRSKYFKECKAFDGCRLEASEKKWRCDQVKYLKVGIDYNVL